MKINKIICDICEKEIDIDKDTGLAMFEYISVDQKIIFGPDGLNNYNNMRPDKDIKKVSYDICKSCAEKMMKNINELKKSNKK